MRQLFERNLCKKIEILRFGSFRASLRMMHVKKGLEEKIINRTPGVRNVNIMPLDREEEDTEDGSEGKAIRYARDPDARWLKKGSKLQ